MPQVGMVAPHPDEISRCRVKCDTSTSQGGWKRESMYVCIGDLGPPSTDITVLVTSA
jgi:hypothetical protein